GSSVRGLLATRLAEILALQPVTRAEEMAQEIFVPFAGRAEQVRAPYEEIAREVLGIVRILAGHAQAATLETGNDMILQRNTARFRLGRERQRIDGELRCRGEPAHAFGPDIEVDEAAAIGGGIGERRQKLADLELFVAPLIAVGVEKRGSIHVTRRPRPSEPRG